MARLAPSGAAGETVKLHTHPERQSAVPQNVKKRISVLSINSTPRYILISTGSSNLNRYSLTAAFFTITPGRKLPKCASVDERKTACAISRHWNSIQLTCIPEMTKIVNFMLCIFCYNKKE